jgi:hypothetical protein
VCNQRNEEQHKENNEQNFRDSGSRYRNTRKAKYRRNQCDDKESQCPVQHSISPFLHPTRVSLQLGCHCEGPLNSTPARCKVGENYLRQRKFRRFGRIKLHDL